MRKTPRFVTLRCERLLEPFHGFIRLALLYQVGANVVVRIPKVRVDLDRLLTFLNRPIHVPGQRVGPPAEGVRFCRRKCLDRARVEFDGLAVFSLGLALIRASKEFHSELWITFFSHTLSENR